MASQAASEPPPPLTPEQQAEPSPLAVLGPPVVRVEWECLRCGRLIRFASQHKPHLPPDLAMRCNCGALLGLYAVTPHGWTRLRLAYLPG